VLSGKFGIFVSRMKVRRTALSGNSPDLGKCCLFMCSIVCLQQLNVQAVSVRNYVDSHVKRTLACCLVLKLHLQLRFSASLLHMVHMSRSRGNKLYSVVL
jgi:hypothetical protein